MESTVDLKDLKTAYRNKSNQELRYTYYIFKILQYPKLTGFLTACANAIIKYNLPLKFKIKKKVFKIFCAGETVEEAFKIIKQLEKHKVKAVLDYVSEGEKNDLTFMANADIITANSLILGETSTGNHISVKLSSLEDTEFFRQINGNTFPENKRFETFLNRLDMICKTAFQQKVIVYIDAEDRCMQDIFDKTTAYMMEKYNKEVAIVFKTLQMYLKDRLDYLDLLIREGKEKKYIPAIKLVRGAYLNKERESAIRKKRESPIYGTKNQTGLAFNKAMEICLSNFKAADTCIASHNDETTLLAINYIEKHKITNHSSKVTFSQLYGMSDHITVNLAAKGYNTVKYLPYSEVKKALPYLIMRSEENSSINGQMSSEIIRLKLEMERSCL